MLQPLLISRPREIAEEVARLARQLLGPTLTVIWFGSWPKGTADPHVDIDITLDAASAIPLQELIEAIPTLREIDLIDLHKVGAPFRNEVLRHGIRL